MTDYNKRFKIAIDFLTKENHYNYIIIVKDLNAFKKKYYNNKKHIATSSASITRMCDGRKEVTKPILDFIDDFLSTLGIEWNEENKKYEFIEGIEKIKEVVYEEKDESEQSFENIKGVYEMYHLSRFGDAILKNIIRITEQGDVFIDGHDNYRHKGKAKIFKTSFLSIQIEKLIAPSNKEEAFFYNILANIDANMYVGKIFHFFGISTTVSLTNEVMANKRLFIKLSDNENDENKDWIHQLFQVDNQEEIQKINQSKIGKIADFLIENSSLIIKEKINQRLY
jgi:hypothetical protein